MTYREYTTKWNNYREQKTLNELFAFYAAGQNMLLPAVAASYVFRMAAEKRRLSVSLVRQFHVLASYGTYDEQDALLSEISPPGVYRHSKGNGCPPEECESVVSDFIQEIHGFGQNNPLFYVAYIIGEFCRFQPFSYANLETAVMITNHFLMTRRLAPLLFLESEKNLLQEDLNIYLAQENLQPLLARISEISDKTAAHLFPIE